MRKTPEDIFRVEQLISKLRSIITLKYNLSVEYSIPTSMTQPYEISKRIKANNEGKLKSVSLYHRNMIDCVKTALRLVNELMSSFRSKQSAYENGLEKLKEKWSNKIRQMLREDAIVQKKQSKIEWDAFVEEFNSKNSTRQFVQLKDEPLQSQIERFMATFHSFKVSPADISREHILNDTTVRLEEMLSHYRSQQSSLSECDKNDSKLAKRLTESSRGRILNILDMRRASIEESLQNLSSQFQKHSAFKKRESDSLRKAQQIYYGIIVNKLYENENIMQWKLNDLISREIKLNLDIFGSQMGDRLQNELKLAMVGINRTKNRIYDTYSKYMNQLNNDHQLLVSEIETLSNNTKKKSVKKAIRTFLGKGAKYVQEHTKNINNQTVFNLLNVLSSEYLQSK